MHDVVSTAKALATPLFTAYQMIYIPKVIPNEFHYPCVTRNHIEP